MRQAVVFVGLLAFAACSGAGSRGPAWPKQAARDPDGGESLAPHLTSSVAAVELAEDIKLEDKPIAKPDEPVKATPGVTPSVPTVTKPDEPITTEDIVIEIDD